MKDAYKNQKKPFLRRLRKNLREDWILYVMTLPVVIYLLIFEYYPVYGLRIAFSDFKVKLGIMGSPWNNFKYFKQFFSSYQLPILIKNTLSISVYSLLVGFPIPIFFALFLNYLKYPFLKKWVQMVSYAPHFLSTVVVCGMISLFSTPGTGAFNIIREHIGMESVNFLTVPEWFQDIYVWSGVWQSMGWSAIIYISALSGVDYQLHEAAIIDGATKMQRIRHIDLPGIKPTIVMLLIMNMGKLMSVGFEKVYLLQNDINYDTSAIISTYVYKVGLVNAQYGFSTAVGLFNNVINVTLMLSANYFSKKVLSESLF